MPFVLTEDQELGVRIVLAGGSLAVLAATRRWHQHWGATDEEIACALPGDDLIPRARDHMENGIDMAAPPSGAPPCGSIRRRSGRCATAAWCSTR